MGEPLPSSGERQSSLLRLPRNSGLAERMRSVLWLWRHGLPLLLCGAGERQRHSAGLGLVRRAKAGATSHRRVVAHGGGAVAHGGGAVRAWGRGCAAGWGSCAKQGRGYTGSGGTAAVACWARAAAEAAGGAAVAAGAGGAPDEGGSARGKVVGGV